MQKLFAGLLFVVSLFSLAETVRSQTGTAAVVFAPGVISTGHEAGIAFTPDGHEIYFGRRIDRSHPAHIYHSRFVEGAWQTPDKIVLGGDEWFELDPFVSPDGQKLFFVSNRPYGKEAVDIKSLHIWCSTKQAQGWSAPIVLESVNSRAKDGTPSVDAKGTLYFFSDRKNGPNKDSIYVSRPKHRVYSTPNILPSPINSDTSDTSPFILPNGKMLLFYSTRPGGQGDADIYVSRKKRGHWTPPVNLGPNVNSKDEEDNPSLSPDGKHLYFGRNGTIFVIPTSAVPALQE